MGLCGDIKVGKMQNHIKGETERLRQLMLISPRDYLGQGNNNTNDQPAWVE